MIPFQILLKTSPEYVVMHNYAAVTCVEALSENANEEGIDYRDNFA